MADAKKRSNFLQFLLIFGLVYIASQFLLKQFFPEQFGGEKRPPGIYLKMTDATLTQGHHPEVTVENRLAAGTGSTVTITLANRCPEPPLDVFRIENPGVSGEQRVPLTTTVDVSGCEDVVPTGGIAPGGSEKISLAPWKDALFGSLGTYEVRLPNTDSNASLGTGSVLSTRFEMREPGPHVKAFRTFITAPFLNFLIFIASLLPDHNLGLAIIILTLIVKLILFIPTKHALEGQKKMQLLQPKLEALKKKYPDDAKKVQEETMKLWQEHKVNPFQSCLPTLIQFPILIGLFYVIRDGSHLEVSRHLIYPIYQNLDWTFGTHFLGLDLLKPSLYIMPPLLVIMQFLQMKLAFAIQKRKQKKQDVIDVGDKKKEEKTPATAQDMQQRIMLYGLPLMIGVFAFQFPAAVSLYWGISTLFGIGQQILVNREHLRV